MNTQQFIEVHRTVSGLRTINEQTLPSDAWNELKKQTITMAIIQLEFMLEQCKLGADVCKAQDARILQLQKDYQALETSYMNLAGDDPISVA